MSKQVQTGSGYVNRLSESAKKNWAENKKTLLDPLANPNCQDCLGFGSQLLLHEEWVPIYLPTQWGSINFRFGTTRKCDCLNSYKKSYIRKILDTLKEILT